MLQVKNDGINGPDQWSANFLCKKCLMLLLSFAVERDNGHKQCRDGRARLCSCKAPFTKAGGTAGRPLLWTGGTITNGHVRLGRRFNRIGIGYGERK